MACASCGVSKDGKPGGCSGNCSGGCNRMNTFDWLSQLDIQDVENSFDLVEISFKNGSRKEFYHNPQFTHTSTGDLVLVEVPGGGGYDVGKISLSGDLVRLQIKKKGIKEGTLFQNVIRRANERDVEKLDEVRAIERDSMIRARAIARTLDLDMKLGDVEYQGDGRKATFFYTADGRVDFRELIRHFAKEFKVKIEMRQIGARQESARIGGLGSCGRELCCSTWLSDFKSVSTAAARYQQLAINQAKLSGMCGRLKCCLNYELDTYLDALEEFPNNPERLKTKNGNAVLIKTDVFKALLVYVFESGPEKGKFYTLGVSEVKEVIALNKRGELPEDFKDLQFVPTAAKPAEGEEEEEEYDDNYGGDLVGAIELPDDKRKKRKKRKKKPSDGSPSGAHTERPENRDNRDNKNTRDNRAPRDNRDNRENKPTNRDGQAGEKKEQRKPDNPNSQTGEKREQRKPDNPNNPQPPRNLSFKKDASTSDSSETPQQSQQPQLPNERREGGNNNNKRRFNKNKNRGSGNRPPIDGGGGDKKE